MTAFRGIDVNETSELMLGSNREDRIAQSMPR
jgi:hypothetical protein